MHIEYIFLWKLGLLEQTPEKAQALVWFVKWTFHKAMKRKQEKKRGIPEICQGQNSLLFCTAILIRFCFTQLALFIFSKGIQWFIIWFYPRERHRNGKKKKNKSEKIKENLSKKVDHKFKMELNVSQYNKWSLPKTDTDQEVTNISIWIKYGTWNI